MTCSTNLVDQHLGRLSLPAGRLQHGVERVRAFVMGGMEKLVAKTPRSFVPGGGAGYYPLWGTA